MEGEFLSEPGAVATGLVCVLAPTARNAIAWAIGPGRVAVKGTKALKARNRLSFALPSQDLNPQSPKIAARSDRAVDDACRASCVDWYGNARPLFVRGRVLALLGYEIVEGTLDDGRMRELRRVSYAPGRPEITRR